MGRNEESLVAGMYISLQCICTFNNHDLLALVINPAQPNCIIHRVHYAMPILDRIGGPPPSPVSMPTPIFFSFSISHK